MVLLTDSPDTGTNVLIHHSPSQSITLALQVVLLVCVLAFVVIRLEGSGGITHHDQEHGELLDQYQGSNARQAAGAFINRIGGAIRKHKGAKSKQGGAEAGSGAAGASAARGGTGGAASASAMHGAFRGVTADDAGDGASLAHSVQPDARIFKEPVSTWPYTCWTPR